MRIGTTAFVAEQWGRRWITIDTSRVALALARQRIMGAKFPYYFLADSTDGQARKPRRGSLPSPATNRRCAEGVRVRARPAHHAQVDREQPRHQGRHDPQGDRRGDHAACGHEMLYDRPYEDKRKVRVAGRFTVESLSPHKTIPPDATPASATEPPATEDASSSSKTILDNLQRPASRTAGRKERLEFESLDAVRRAAHPGRGGPQER